MRTDPDARTAQKAAAGDAAAFETLLRRYQKPVTALCSRMIGSSQAEDAAQQAFIECWKALPQFRGQSRFSVFLFGVAANCCRNALRRNPRELTLDAAEIPSAEAQDKKTLEKVELERALGRLSQEHRETAILCGLYGFKYQEAAEALDVPVGTIRSRLHYAYEKLRELLSEHDLARSEDLATSTLAKGGADGASGRSR